MPETSSQIFLRAIDLERLRAVAAAVARDLKPGDAIVLDGPLAAGKTQFVTFLCESLGVADAVSSPTFTLAHFYVGPRLGLIHVDAYRLETTSEFADLTLDDFLDENAIVIEWGKKFLDVLPPAIVIEFGIEGAETRTIRISSPAPELEPRIQALRAALEAVTP